MQLGALTAALSLALALAPTAGAYGSGYDPQAPFPAPISPPFAPSVPLGVTFPVPLEPHLNNRAASSPAHPADPAAAAGRGMADGSTYPADLLPRGEWVHDGVAFALPDWSRAEGDNVRADGEVVPLDEAREVRAVHLLCAGEGSGGFNLGNTHEDLGLLFADGTRENAPFVVRTWWAHHWTNKGAIRTPFQFSPAGAPVYNASSIFHAAVRLPPAAAGKRLTALILPRAREHNSLHVFAISAEGVGTSEMMQDRLVAGFVRATRGWEDLEPAESAAAMQAGSDAPTRAQVVEVAVRNPLSASRHADPASWIDRPVRVALRGTGFATVREGYIPRLMPGDEVRVQVLVVPVSPPSAGGGSAAAPWPRDTQVEFYVGDVSWLAGLARVEGAGLVRDFTHWTAEDGDEGDVAQHSAPGWYRGAKFGIFIHWGLFSVPAWAPVPRYAEWYDFWIHDDKPGMPAYEHHLAMYGRDFVYDDFIPQFGAERFNASAWVELVAAAGARYFVFTTKHHDGFALFDTRGTGGRDSVRLGPQRDFVRELMDTAAREQPALHRGTYFSLPEWFNPLYRPHGRVSFPGGPARNPYTGAEEPYTGFTSPPGDDFIRGVQLPQMRLLADEYGTELMWCDIGLANASAEFAAEWFSQAAREGRQVALSNRCGIGGDFDTPEMELFGSVELDPWESCASMDPYSFGYAANTPPDAYRNATNVVHTLLGIAAKGGNFLLNIGPRADGSVPEEMAGPLRATGAWLRTNGRAVFDTAPFPLLPEVAYDGDQAGASAVHVLFTRTPHAFFIISLRDLAPEWVLRATLPLLPADTMFLVTPAGDVRVPWRYDAAAGELTVDLSGVEAGAFTGGIAYVLEVRYAAEREEGVDA